MDGCGVGQVADDAPAALPAQREVLRTGTDPDWGAARGVTVHIYNLPSNRSGVESRPAFLCERSASAKSIRGATFGVVEDRKSVV